MNTIDTFLAVMAISGWAACGIVALVMSKRLRDTNKANLATIASVHASLVDERRRSAALRDMVASQSKPGLRR